MCVFLISPVPITEPLTSELIDTPVFYTLAPRPIKYRVSVPIPTHPAGLFAQSDMAMRLSSPGDLPSSAALSRLRWQSETHLSCAKRLLSYWKRRQLSRSIQLRWGRGFTVLTSTYLRKAVAFGQSWVYESQIGPFSSSHSRCRRIIGCLVHQLAGFSTITLHVTTHPPSPPLESETEQDAAYCPHPGGAQSCRLSALVIAHVPWRMATPSREELNKVNMVASHESSHGQFYDSLTEAPSAQTH